MTVSIRRIAFMEGSKSGIARFRIPDEILAKAYDEMEYVVAVAKGADVETAFRQVAGDSLANEAYRVD